MKINVNRISLWFYLGIEAVALLVATVELMGGGIRNRIAAPALAIHVEQGLKPLLKEELAAFKEEYPKSKRIKVRELKEGQAISELLTKPGVAIALPYPLKAADETSLKSAGFTANQERIIPLPGQDLIIVAKYDTKVEQQFAGFISSQEGQAIAAVLAKKRIDS